MMKLGKNEYVIPTPAASPVDDINRTSVNLCEAYSAAGTHAKCNNGGNVGIQGDGLEIRASRGVWITVRGAIKSRRAHGARFNI